MPLEAQRLGSHASDLNPVAVRINKAMIEIPPKFAGLPPVNIERIVHCTSANRAPQNKINLYFKIAPQFESKNQLVPLRGAPTLRVGE